MKNPTPTLDEVAQHVRDFHGCLLTWPQFYTLFPKQRELARAKNLEIEVAFVSSGMPPANCSFGAFCQAHPFTGTAFEHCFIIHDRTVQWGKPEPLR